MNNTWNPFNGNYCLGLDKQKKLVDVKKKLDSLIVLVVCTYGKKHKGVTQITEVREPMLRLNMKFP